MFEKVASLFVKPEDKPEVAVKPEATEEQPEAAQVAPSRSRSGRSGSSGSSASAESDGDGSVDKDILANLEKALDDHTGKDYGYIQFRDVLAKMKKKIANEAARFQAALASAEAMGCNASAIISSANDAIDVLKGEQTQFNSEIAALVKADDDKDEELKDIEQQIKALQSKQTKINKELSESSTRISTAKQNFQVTYKQVVADIQSDIEKVQEYSSSK